MNKLLLLEAELTDTKHGNILIKQGRYTHESNDPTQNKYIPDTKMALQLREKKNHLIM